jgi:hypothetical protein
MYKLDSRFHIIGSIVGCLRLRTNGRVERQRESSQESQPLEPCFTELLIYHPDNNNDLPYAVHPPQYRVTI